MKQRLAILTVLVLSCEPGRGTDTPISQPDASTVPDASCGSSSASPVGGSCQSDCDCQEITGGARCLTESNAPLAGLNAPGGYCTSLTCSSTNPAQTCGLATVCGEVAGELICEAACAQSQDCRPGYSCIDGGCAPLPGDVDGGSPLDGGPIDGGSACGHLGEGCCADDSCSGGTYCREGSCVAPCEQTTCGQSCVDLQTAPDNCGRCGASCSRPNATSSCSGGACALGSCLSGFYDCDGDLNNGCESSTVCGSTFTRCLTGSDCPGARNECRTSSGGTSCLRRCESNADCPSPQYCKHLFPNDGANYCTRSCTPNGCNYGTCYSQTFCGP